MAENPFRNRMFPHIEAKSVKLSDVIAIFDKMHGKSLVLEDNDAVKICLLVLLQNEFLGHQMSHNISNEMLMLVEDLSNCWNIFPWGSYIWDHTYPKLRDTLNKCQVNHDDKCEKGEEIRYTLTGFVYASMIWILEAIPATHVYVSKEPREKITRAFAWKMILPFSYARCRTLFVGKDVQSEAVSEQLDIEKDAISEEVQKKKKRKRGSSPPSFQNPTYDQLMTIVKSRLLALEGDARISTLTQNVSSLHGTIDNLKSWLLALEGDERDFGVVSDGDISAYMSPGPSYTSPASTAQKSLPLANRRKLRVRHTPLKLKSPMRCYSRKMRCSKPLPASTTMPPVTTILVPMTTTKLLKDTKDAAKDVTKDVAKDTISVPMTTTEMQQPKILFCTEDELQFIGMEKDDKPNYDLPDLSKIKRNKYPIYSTFEKKNTDCYLDCLPKGRTCEPSFWEILYPGGEKAEYIDEGKLDGLHINAFIELMMRKRPRNAHLESSENYEKIKDVLKTWKDFIKKDLENMDWFENTKRDPKCFKISLRYMNDMPKHNFMYGTLDCGVMTCKFIEMLMKRKTIDIKSFGDNVRLKCQEYRAKMAFCMKLGVSDLCRTIS
uniref:Phospholipase-like protein n=1 Tax=Tanacetum cinerariifolium TaxID=118510 RepID=A0A6L2M0U2_TANCI|nr:phospholipase-like protein [Tanacetum cinerariifolium]GEV40525.1 phospholipase-like protein [Tanacetum cinerariifolium]